MEERTEPTTEPAAVEPATEPAAAVEPATEPAAAVEPATEPAAAVEPAPAPAGAKNKKDVIRNALRDAPPEGITADTIVQMIVEAGFVQGDDQEALDKTRHYVIMSISHMRKAGKQVELKEGKYVLTGEQSPTS